MRLLVLILALISWAGAGTAQNLDPASLYVLNASVSAETSQDIAPIITSAPIPRSEAAYWMDAVRIGGSSIANDPDGRASIVRLMEAALIRAGAEPDFVWLDRLSPSDITAMRNAVGFPDTGDLLIYLLNRGPSLRDSFAFESYTAVRFAPEGLSVRILQERADRPYLGVATAFGLEYLNVEDDPVGRAPRELAKTRRINLAALPDIVLAAKAFRAAERAPADQAIYPLLIAVQAVNRAFLADSRDFRSVVYFTELTALDALRNYSGDDPFLLSEERRFENRMPRSAFFARLFEDAAAAYAAVSVLPDDSVGEVWAAWGEALSLFAYEEDAGSAFSNVAQLIGPDTPQYATIFGIFLDYIPSGEAMLLGDVDEWRSRITDMLGTDPANAERPTNLAYDRDFALQMATIGRPDIASRFLMDRIRSTRGSSLETEYLLLLAPFVRDYCYVISFRLSAASSWIRREAHGYGIHLDFLDNFNTDQQLVRPGEVVLSDGSYEPYPMLSPEEDCAAAFAVYGVVDSVPPGSPIDRTPIDERAVLVAGFEGWVVDSLSRSEPAPSLVPYLKLIWLDWFSQAFETLKNPSISAATFHYQAIDASTLTSTDRVSELLQHPAATPYQRSLIELFLDTRTFLEATYP